MKGSDIVSVSIGNRSVIMAPISGPALTLAQMTPEQCMSLLDDAAPLVEEHDEETWVEIGFEIASEEDWCWEVFHQA
jgi:hypothetical protein